MFAHKFDVLPVLEIIKELYNEPISPERFKAYIKKLQGSTKGDLMLPISGYNPMAKAHVIKKIQELQYLHAEDIVTTITQDFNMKLTTQNYQTIKIVLNVADDLKGGWTNHYTTDFDSKFKINALVSRNFCTPYFWTSESYSRELITTRSLEYMYRTLYWKTHGRLKTLKDHVEQECYVQQQLKHNNYAMTFENITEIDQFYKAHLQEDDYSVIFNFFYGDKVSKKLHYPSYGIYEVNGFSYAKYLANTM